VRKREFAQLEVYTRRLSECALMFQDKVESVLDKSTAVEKALASLRTCPLEKPQLQSALSTLQSLVRHSPFLHSFFFHTCFSIPGLACHDLPSAMAYLLLPSEAQTRPPHLWMLGRIPLPPPILQPPSTGPPSILHRPTTHPSPTRNP